MEQEPAKALSFEESLAALERTVRELEEGRLGLDDALARYEQGVGLIKACYTQLRQAEQRILLLTGLSEDGQPVLQPFKHEATAARGTSSLGSVVPAAPAPASAVDGAASRPSLGVPAPGAPAPAKRTRAPKKPDETSY
jgi:exodeoxyribonuclease VII small subunit